MTTTAQQQGNNTDCTSNPKTPADIVLNGKCVAMDVTTRTFKMKDTDGTEHPFKWTEPLDVVMVRNGEAKWKSGYYLAVTYNPDTHTVKNVAYWQEGKDKFPKTATGGGGRPYQPRNEKPMVYESAFKSCVDLVRPDDFVGMNYAERVEAVRIEADKIAKWIVVNGGA